MIYNKKNNKLIEKRVNKNILKGNKLDDGDDG